MQYSNDAFRPYDLVLLALTLAMRTELPNLPALLAFECAARHLSFASAAIELNLAQSTVSHRVRLLENQLDCKLFERLPRNLKLTEVGKTYLPNVRKTFDELAISTAGLFGASSNKIISVRASVSYELLWLIPRLHSFWSQHPNITIKLQTSVWPDDLSKEEIDLEIRFGHGNWDGYQSQLIHNDVAVMLCSPTTQKNNGKIKHVKSLLDKNLIHIFSMEDLWFRFFQKNNLDFKQTYKSLYVDSTVAALDLASSNNDTYVFAPKLLADKHISEKKLTQAYKVELPIKSAHYLLTPITSSPQKPETGLFKSWLLDNLKS